MKDGIAVIIDDDIGDENANVSLLIDSIEAKHIPCIKYVTLPNDRCVKNFADAAFIILDWNLHNSLGSLGEYGVRSTLLKEEDEQENIRFIQLVLKSCFVPLFIFTNENTADVESKLRASDLYTADIPNRIFIESKSSLVNGNDLDLKITQWTKKNPSVQILNKWDFAYKKAKSELFNDFYAASPCWPLIMKKEMDEDGISPDTAFIDLITRNLITRISPLATVSFDSALLANSKSDRTAIEKVLQGERYIHKRKLGDKEIRTGDLFKLDGKYYLNIKSHCDLLRCNRTQLDLYLLEGTVFTDEEIQTRFESEYAEGWKGNWKNHVDEAIISYLDDQKHIRFSFRDFSIRKWVDIKDYRVGRLLDPYMLNVQQRFSLYISRQGFLRIPEVLMPTSNQTDTIP